MRFTGGLHVVRVAIDPGTLISDHRHGQPTLVAMERGATDCILAGRRTHAPAASIQFVAAGSERTICAGPDGAVCLVITADPMQAVGAHRHWDRGTQRMLMASTIPELWTRLMRATGRPGAPSSELERTLLAILQFASRPARAPRAPWLQAALRWLEQAPGGVGTVRDLSRQLELHPVHVARVVREATGVSIREFVRQRRVAQAQALLRETSASVSAIAHRTGFADQSHLCREFGRRLGVSPSHFRARPGDDVALVQVEDIPGVHLGRVMDDDRPSSTG